MAKPFAAFDVDGVIFKSSLVEKVVDVCITAGLFAGEAFATARDYRRRWQMNNNEDVYQTYLRHLVGAFVAQIAGVEVQQFDEAVGRVIVQHADRKFGFPRRLMSALRPSHYIVAISGSPDILVRPFLQDITVDQSFGSQFEVIDGRYTGKATSVEDKAVILGRLVTDGVVCQEGSVSVGDTISDVSMLEYADTAILFNASSTLTNYSMPRGWIRVNEVKDQVTVLGYDPNIEKYVELEPSSLINSLRA